MGVSYWLGRPLLAVRELQTVTHKFLWTILYYIHRAKSPIGSLGEANEPVFVLLHIIFTMPFGMNITNKQNTVDLTLYFSKPRSTLCCCQSGKATGGELAEAYILTCK